MQVLEYVRAAENSLQVLFLLLVFVGAQSVEVTVKSFGFKARSERGNLNQEVRGVGRGSGKLVGPLGSCADRGGRSDA